jgi:hypothetical protein
MEHSPSKEADSHSVTHEITHILCNSKAQYHIHYSPPPDPTLSQMNPIHIPTPTSFKIHFNIIVTSMSSLPSGNFHLEYPSKSVCFLLCGNDVSTAEII